MYLKLDSITFASEFKEFNIMKSPYLPLWILLTVSLVIFVSISFAGDIKLGGWQIKKGKFNETLTLNSSMTAVEDTTFAEVNIPEEESELVETDTLPKNIFLFGDSMTLNLALRMEKYAENNGHSFHAVNWDSSNTKLWAETDTLQYYLNKYKPDYIFISLGSNEVFFKNPESRLPYIRKIIKTIGDIPFIWIGPPNWNEDTGINDVLEKECGKGNFFRSQGIEMKRKTDNIHPTRNATNLWVDSIMRWLPFSSHPILADYPSDSLKVPHTNIIILKALNQ